MKFLGRDSTEPPWTYALAGALMGGGPVWHYLYSNHYPFPRVEALILPGAGALGGLLLSSVAYRVGGAVGTVFFGALLFAFADLQFDLQKYVYTAALPVLCISLSVLLRERRATITSLTLVAFYAASLVRPPLVPSAPAHERQAAARNGQPILVHIILDEEWGIGGLRAAGDTATAAYLTAFYLDRGFEVYDAGYSRFQYSMESIPATLSLGRTPDFNPQAATKPYWRSLHRNPYFERLQGLGYQIEVFQTTYLDFCRSVDAQVAGCHVVSGNSVANVGYLGGSWITRAMLAGRYFLNMNSHVYSRLHGDPEVARRSITGGALASARSLQEAIQAHPGDKTAYFAHLLLPHRPIDVDAECSALKDPNDRIYGDYPQGPMDPPWPRKMTLLANQIRCTHRVLGEIIDVIDRSVGRDGAIVIVHGDHGARLHGSKPAAEELSQLNARQLNSIFSTILAVRRPGIPAADHPEPVPVQDFVWKLAGADFAGAVEGPWQHFLRKMPSKTEPSDTLRVLTRKDMLWVSPHD